MPGLAGIDLLDHDLFVEREPWEVFDLLQRTLDSGRRVAHVLAAAAKAILGEVASPGLYLIDPTMRLADAVALAGGASPDGNLEGPRVVRDGDDITQYVALESPLLNQLESGDQIQVPEKSWLRRNGIVLLASTISALAIIYAATLR